MGKGVDLRKSGDFKLDFNSLMTPRRCLGLLGSLKLENIRSKYRSIPRGASRA